MSKQPWQDPTCDAVDAIYHYHKCICCKKINLVLGIVLQIFWKSYSTFAHDHTKWQVYNGRANWE